MVWNGDHAEFATVVGARSAVAACLLHPSFVGSGLSLSRCIMLRVMRNGPSSGNALLPEGLQILRRRLPEGWKAGDVRDGPSPFDATVRLRAPGGAEGRLVLRTMARLDPRGVVSVAALAEKAAARGPLLIVSPYLSPSTRERLREAEISFLDLTGNARLVMSKPGLFIETQGASEDPDRKVRPARSLSGPKAGRIVRALIDRKRLPGVRELAAATRVDAGYVSRVLSLLDSEALITRGGRGRIERVDWPALLRRWAREAPLESRGEVRSFLEPRGLSSLLPRVGESGGTYAVTGGLAAARFAPIAPARLAVIWVRSSATTAERLELRPAESGANVLLVEPTDDLVFEGATEHRGVRYAAPSQVAADLLTSPGRGPAEGEALLKWMRENEEAWRG